MEFKGRALYNLLRLSTKQDPSIKVSPWQTLDYRCVSEPELFATLSSIGLPLTKENFLLYAKNCEAPEELAECLSLEEWSPETEAHSYLILFELWRRLLPGKQSLSIFCDELDRLISDFDDGVLIEDESWQAVLTELSDILDQNTVGDADLKEVFASVSQYTAHNIETFLYDYIVEVLEVENEPLAASLIEAFEDYVSEKKWFSLLRVRLLSSSGIKTWQGPLSRLLEEQSENPDLSFLMEVLAFLREQDDAPLFFECAKQIVPLVRVEEEIQELLHSMAQFCSPPLQGSILSMIEKRSSNLLSETIAQSDTRALEELLSAR